MKRSLKPSIWGPYGWKFMHFVSLGYPDNPTSDDKRNYKEFYNSLQGVLPCERCAINYKQNIIDSPIDGHLDNRDALVKWVVDIHNTVNNELQKDQIGYEDAVNLYLNEESHVLEYCFRLTVLAMILYFIYIIMKK